MKNIIVTFLVIIAFSCKAQNPIVNLTDRDGTRENGAYYKDVNNLLNQFEGTWLYTNNGINFKIILKKIMCFNGVYYQDMLIGEYQYIGNGVVYDSLDDINTVYPNQHLHRISGNQIYTSARWSPFQEFIPGETVVSLFMNETPLVGAELYIRKTTVFGHEAIQIFKSSESADTKKGEQRGYTAYPDGEYILKKQP